MKKGRGKYDASGLIESQVEPGSGGRVLKNLLGVKRKREMDRIEMREYLRVLDELVDVYKRNHRFTAADICRMHRLWLERVYQWAGSYRKVNISKGGFLFAAAERISRLMTGLERGPLRDFTPCRPGTESEVAEALAVVHVELVLVHPFREGNGRLARLLAILMALQAGLPPLDFNGIKGKRKQEYFRAVQAGMDRNCEPMKRIFISVIRRTRGSRGR